LYSLYIRYATLEIEEKEKSEHDFIITFVRNSEIEIKITTEKIKNNFNKSCNQKVNF